MSGNQRLFINDAEISDYFLEFVSTFVEGLEVERNQLWEWEDTIVDGYDIFHRLRHEKQGTISIYLDRRSIQFRPEVAVALAGRVAGFGMAQIEGTVSHDEVIREAILRTLDLDPVTIDNERLAITEFVGGVVRVKASGVVQQAMWDREIISFRATVNESPAQTCCTVLAND